MECGLVLPSISCWEVVSQNKGVTLGRHMCNYCKGTRFAQLGRKVSQRVRLQLILDEPPEILQNKWAKERVPYCVRWEPHAAPSNAWAPWGESVSNKPIRITWL